MIKKFLRYFLLAITGLVFTAACGCGIRYNVRGTVIDMDTGQPVEGAVVSIKWEKEHFSLPGMGGKYTFLELADDLTGPDGKFKIPKYTFRNYHLAAYKKGYVCWDCEDIFPRKEREGMALKYYDKREGFKVANGMIIELEPFRNFYSKEEHAIWVDSVHDHNSDFGSFEGEFSRMTEEERALYEAIMKKGKER